MSKDKFTIKDLADGYENSEDLPFYVSRGWAFNGDLHFQISVPVLPSKKIPKTALGDKKEISKDDLVSFLRQFPQDKKAEDRLFNTQSVTLRSRVTHINSSGITLTGCAKIGMPLLKKGYPVAPTT